MTVRLLAVVASLFCACAEPTRVRIANAKGLEDVELVTLEDLDQVRGVTAEVLMGARLRLDPVPEIYDDARRLVATHAEPFRAHYTVSDGVAVALELDTLMAFSMYAHLERAALYFEDLGVHLDAATPVYYEPVIQRGVLPGVAYIVSADVFVVTPGVTGQLPVALSTGVLTHETSHRLWHTEVWRRDLLHRLATIAADMEQLAAYQLLRAADEGVADYFGAVVTGNPRFHSNSFTGLESRYLDGSYAVAPEWLSGTLPTIGGAYDPYPLGTVLGSCLWRSRQDLGAAVDAALVTSLRALSESVAASPLRYEVGDFEMELLGRIDACEHFEEAYAVVWHRFASVCP